MADFYVTEERAMAPGIAGNWPRVIPKPDNKNGRLVKVENLQQKMNGVIEELTKLNGVAMIPEQQRRIIGDLAGIIRSVFSST